MSAANTIIKLPEPRLLFRHSQGVEDPRDGLTLFGPLDAGSPYGIRAGVIGTQGGISAFKRWVTWIQRPVTTEQPNIARPPFPGFEAIFRIPWSPTPSIEQIIQEEELNSHLFLDDRHQRVFETVNFFADKITNALTDEETKADVWFVIVPDSVWQYCRPQSVLDPNLRRAAQRSFGSARHAKDFYQSPSLFAEQNQAAQPYFYKEHFRNQLKAKLLKHRIATQVIRESTLNNIGRIGEHGATRGTVILQSAIAWHLATAAFYKSGGRPWKVAGIREGVCYVGLVFKKDDRTGDNRSSCCGAQMFLDSGDGVVFKGAVGPWYSPDHGDFHLSRMAAKSLVQLALQSYVEKTGHPPREMFLHGQVRFNRNEWQGFEEAVGTSTNLVGVKIRDDSTLKLFRMSDNPVLRGTAYIDSDRSAYLWTRGWTPRLNTYPGREVPNPLRVEICEGSSDIRTVLADILALTKLNYNACVFGDGKPITLKFADAVGEVLTAGPIEAVPPLPFMYYI